MIEDLLPGWQQLAQDWGAWQYEPGTVKTVCRLTLNLSAAGLDFRTEILRRVVFAIIALARTVRAPSEMAPANGRL